MLQDADVDYINDRNAHFNKKIGRAFDKCVTAYIHLFLCMYH